MFTILGEGVLAFVSETAHEIFSFFCIWAELSKDLSKHFFLGMFTWMDWVFLDNSVPFIFSFHTCLILVDLLWTFLIFYKFRLLQTVILFTAFDRKVSENYSKLYFLIYWSKISFKTQFRDWVSRAPKHL